MKTVAEINARIETVKAQAYAIRDSGTVELRKMEEEIELLSTIAGEDEEDKMTADGVLDYAYTEYPEGSEFAEMADAVVKWVL